MGELKLSMKLLVDTVGKRVLFAEAGKECVDFLFFLLSLPLSTVIRLLGKEGMVGTVSNLYKSVESLHDSYVHSTQQNQERASETNYSTPWIQIEEEPSTGVKKVYICSDGCENVSDDPRAICPDCGNLISSITNYVAPPGIVQQAIGGGFVKGVVTYMVMDDLVVKPMSTISSITLLNQLNIKDVGTLEEKVVTFGINEAVKLLKASLETDKVLTNVFLSVNK